jgi:hypothetical protein
MTPINPCHRLYRYVLFAALLLISSQALIAQTAQIVRTIRNVNLRTDPSTVNDPTRLLGPGVTLTLVEAAKKRNYYHVRTPEGEDGWVWARNVDVVAGGELPPPVPAAIAPAVNRSWPKPTPSKSTFEGLEGPCPAEGDASDADQFILKNRSDVPASYHDITWEAIYDLPYPGKDDKADRAKNLRKKWTAAQLSVIRPFEGVPVRVVGYLSKVKPQTGGKGEGTNCHQHLNGDVDAHLAFVKDLGDPESEAIVIEWTPRLLKAHPSWTKAKLTPLTDKPVRISGFLMVDPDHYGHLGKYRNTIWEIHPITRIEVTVDGHFVDLDDID